MRVLVTGGAGYIGSVVTEELIAQGEEVVVYDNLTTGHRAAVHPEASFVRGDIQDGARLLATLREERVEAVIHMAAISIVGESVRKPSEYLQNNVSGALSLLSAMVEAGVSRLVFSSTASVYGEPVKQPIEEGDPTRPTNPYGASKLAIEQFLPWYHAAYGLSSASLRYFNAAGATAARGEDHHPETHLVPLLLKAARGDAPPLSIFGEDYPTRDGTCVRDYIHVVDLARAHILALRAMPPGTHAYNLGCGGDGYTVREVIAAAERVTGRKIPCTVGPRRPGDPPRLIASSAHIRSALGWAPATTDLDTLVGSAWAWHRRNPDGYLE